MLRVEDLQRCLLLVEDKISSLEKASGGYGVSARDYERIDNNLAKFNSTKRRLTVLINLALLNEGEPVAADSFESTGK